MAVKKSKKSKAPKKAKKVKKITKKVKKTKKVVKKKKSPKKVKKVSKVKKAKKAPKKVAKKAPKKVAKPVKTTVSVKSEAVKKTFTKTELQRAIAAHAGITKQEVGKVFEALTQLIHNHVRKGAAGLVKLEGLLKIEKVHKPAKKARKGINPFTGEEMMFKAKPAHDVIKVRALKKLKQMVK